MNKNFLAAVFLIFGAVGSASANLISNGNFDDGLSDWTTSGDVRIGNTASLLGGFASAQGMMGNYALLGLVTTTETSQLRQDFEVTGLDKITISFNWAFDYWDNSATAQDTFLSFVRQDGVQALKISLLDLKTTGTGFYTPDGGIAHGYYTNTLDISAYQTPEARLIFRLSEGSDSDWFTGTASLAGIDNVVVSGTAPVPEPATLLLMGTGLAGLIAVRRRKAKKA